MCGRYSLALRPSQVRAYLQDADLQVDDAPDDDGDNVPRHSYNFAPGYNGLVYRADVPYYGAGSSKKHSAAEEPTDAPSTSTRTSTEPGTETETGTETAYKLQTMRWGLIPSWTKRNPDYGSMMKTINCRDDSLVEDRGMWTGMKRGKRCVVVVQGFYEWLKKGPKEKVPHYVRLKGKNGDGDGEREEEGLKEGGLMLLAGLWDCVSYEGSEDKTWTYTIITTSSNPQLRFLHDRMPVILPPNSSELQTWLDPTKNTWSKELQSILKPYNGELDVYAVSKEVGKVGNNSPAFIVPVASRENKSNIANFFTQPKQKVVSIVASEKDGVKDEEKHELKKEGLHIKHELGEDRETVDHEGTEDNAPLPVTSSSSPSKGPKRELEDSAADEKPPTKAPKMQTEKKTQVGRSKDPNTNQTRSSGKGGVKEKESMKITSFFAK